MQELEPFGLQFVRQHIDAREITAGVGEAADETEPDWIVADQKHRGGLRGGCFGRECRRRASGGDNYGGLVGQLARHVRQMIDSVFCPAVDDRDVSALNKSDLFEALTE
jgi:hypothetical protein